MMKEQLTLPYEEIKSVAGRQFIRDADFITQGGKVSYKIPFNRIEERPGFNQRESYEGIEELAESIFLHKQKTPFDLDVLPDGRVFIYRGHRRWRAYKLLIEQGRLSETDLVYFFPTLASVTEIERMADQFHSNNHHEKFKPLEQAGVANVLKRHFGKERTNEEVAGLMGVSRQTVDNLIAINASPEDIKHEIRIGNMSLSAALNLIRSQKKLQKQTDKQEMDAAQSSMYTQQVPKDELAGEMKELDALDQQSADMREQERIAQEEKNSEEDFAKLLEIADVVAVSRGALSEYENKKLAREAIKSWSEDFVNEDTAEVVTINRNEVVAITGTVITPEIIETLVEEGVTNVYVYKLGQEPVTPSVITVLPEGPEKDRYDIDRPEIAQVQNCIKLADRMENRVNKLEGIDEGTKKDFGDWVKWMQKDLAELREWIHKNKKQNKIR